MKKQKTARWHLNSSEVSMASTGSTFGTRKHATRAGRESTVTGSECMLTHRPTKISATGSIPSGNYSRSEMKSLKEKLYNKLFLSLEEKVAKQLKIPGR